MNQDVTKPENINDAAKVISTFHLSALVWKFEDCPLVEISHYFPNGKEDVVVVCDKESEYLAKRMVPTLNDKFETEDYAIILIFHPIYRIVIGMDPTGESNRES